MNQKKKPHVVNVSLLEGNEKHRNIRLVICHSGDISCQGATEKKNQGKDSHVPTSYLKQWSRMDI